MKRLRSTANVTSLASGDAIGVADGNVDIVQE